MKIKKKKIIGVEKEILYISLVTIYAFWFNFLMIRYTIGWFQKKKKEKKKKIPYMFL